MQQALIRQLVTIATTIPVIVGYAFLAGLPLRGVSRAVQGAVLLMAVFLVVLFAPQTSARLDQAMATHHVTSLLVVLTIAGVSWFIIRKLRLSVAHTAVQAIGMVVVGTALMFLL